LRDFKYFSRIKMLVGWPFVLL